ncbi:hypothetical protein Godav_027966 [Gossypium davidsonii]|uniref:Uncharacterized protein n=1 Tax=Gossypium davidsonii TaxID=34287 RepID=A0A7J8RYG4_GOSDV|nr:hypothetical protein [Gossypium davidsonii]
MGTTIHENGTWDDTVICEIAMEDQVQAILFIPLAKSPIPDTKIWRLEGSSMYIMKSDYKLLVQGKSDLQQALSNPMAFSEKDFFLELWALQFSEKIKITMREANNATHTLAKKEGQFSEGKFWIEDALEEVEWVAVIDRSNCFSLY